MLRISQSSSITGTPSSDCLVSYQDTHWWGAPPLHKCNRCTGKVGICVYLFVHVYMSVCMYACMCVCVCAYIFVHRCVYTCIFVYMCLCMSACVCVFQWDMFGSSGMLAADTACCKAPGVGKKVCCLTSWRVREGPSSASGEGWSEEWFIFGTRKSVFQTFVYLISCQKLLGTTVFIYSFISFFFLF